MLLAGLSWTLLGWTENVLLFPDSFPQELAPSTALALLSSGLILGATAFSAAGGLSRARSGGAFGLTMGAIGACASRWPQLSRAIELNGGIFAGPFLAATLPTIFALTAAGAAAALTLDDARPRARALLLAAVALWAVPTAATEAALTRWWGYGPRTVASAAGIPTNASSETLAVVRLAPSRGRTVTRENVRMAAQNADLRPESLVKIDAFLRRVDFRDVFAAEALADLRRGWLSWWRAEDALDAMMIGAPGRAHPDYRGALDLIKVGPMTPERFKKLERLDASATASTAGFEGVTRSQYIFEDFAAAYARFGDEKNARRWLARLDNLLLIADKKIEVAPLEDFRAGVVGGSVLLDGRPATGVMVGLFAIWRSTPTAAGARLLSGSAFPDENGEFAFSNLGPGEYELALLGRVEDLRGEVLGSPGRFELGYERPEVELRPIRIERDVLSPLQSFAPSRLPDAPTPEVPEPPLLWRKR